MAPRRHAHLVLTLVLVNACAAARPERAAADDAARPAGRQLTQRAPDAAWIFGALSPDGATAVSMSDDGTLELIDIATGGVRALPPPPAGTMTGDGSWHDDGVLRVLTRDGDRLRTWKLEPLAGTFTEEQRPDADADGTSLWYGPDGRYATIRDDGLYVVGADGRDARRIFDSNAGDLLSPVGWSADAAFLYAFRITNGRGASLELVNTRGEPAPRILVDDPRLIVDSGAGLAIPAGARRLIFSLRVDDGVVAQDIYALEIDDAGVPRGAPVRLAHHSGGLLNTPSYSAAAQRLLATHSVVQADVYAASFDVETRTLGPARRLTAGVGDETPVGITASGDVVLAQRRDGRWAALSLPLADPPGAPLPDPVSAAQTAIPTGPGGWLLMTSTSSLAHIVGRKRTEIALRQPIVIAASAGASHAAAQPGSRALRCATAAPRCMVLSTNADGRSTLELVELEEGTTRALPPSPPGRSWGAVDLSRDGRYIALVEQADSANGPTRQSLLVVSLDDDGTPVRTIPLRDGLLAQSVAFHPDGTGWFITGMSWGQPHAAFPDGGTYGLLFMGLDGESTVLTTTRSAWIAHPFVSHDGRTVVFHQQSFDTDLWLFDGL